MKVWDAHSGELLQTFPQPGQVADLGFSPDGSRLAAATWAGPRVWEPASGRVLLDLQGASDHITWSADGQRVAFDVNVKTEGNKDPKQRAVKVHDLRSGKDVFSTPPEKEEVKALALSPNGKRLAVSRPGGAKEGLTRVWDIASGKEVIALDQWRPILRFTPDGSELTRASAFLMDTRELVAGKVVKTSWCPWPGSSPASGVAVSPDGKRLAAGGEDGLVRLWNSAAGDELRTYRGLTAAAHHLAFSPDGKRLAASAGMGSLNRGGIRIWDVSRPQDYRQGPPPEGFLKQLSHGSPVHSPDGLHFAVKGKLVELFQESKKSGGYWVTESEKEWEVWDGKAGKAVLMLRHPARINAVGFNAAGRLDGRLLAAPGEANGQRHELALWHAETGALATPLKEGKYHLGLNVLAFSPDGSLLAAGGGSQNEPGMIQVWDTHSGALLSTFKSHSAGVTALAFSADGKRLASHAWGGWLKRGEMKVWDLRQKRELLSLDTPCASPDLSFSPDGHLLQARDVPGGTMGPETTFLWDATPFDR